MKAKEALAEVWKIAYEALTELEELKKRDTAMKEQEICAELIKEFNYDREWKVKYNKIEMAFITTENGKNICYNTIRYNKYDDTILNLGIVKKSLAKEIIKFFELEAQDE